MLTISAVSSFFAHFAGVIIALLSTIGLVVPDVGSSSLGSSETGAQDIVAATDLRDERHIDWISASASGANEIAVTFPAGSKNCFGYWAELEETPTTIKVRVVEGALESAPDDCALIGFTARLTVQTVDPVGLRNISQ